MHRARSAHWEWGPAWRGCPGSGALRCGVGGVSTLGQLSAPYSATESERRVRSASDQRLVVPPPAPTPVDRSGTVGGAEETDTGSGTDSRPVGRSDAAASAGSSAEPPAAPPSSLSLYETLRGRARMPSRLVGTMNSMALPS